MRCDGTWKPMFQTAIACAMKPIATNATPIEASELQRDEGFGEEELSGSSRTSRKQNQAP